MHRCKEWFYFSNFFLFFRPNKRIDQLPLPCGCLFATTAAANATFLRAETVAVPHITVERSMTSVVPPGNLVRLTLTRLVRTAGVWSTRDEETLPL